MIIRVTAVLSLLLPLGPLSSANEWPEFRGGSWANVRDGVNLPTEWGPNKNIAWTTPIPGSGWSSPILSGGQLFLTTVTTSAKEENPQKGL